MTRIARKAALLVALVLPLSAGGCATTSTSSTTWGDPGAPGYAMRTGTVATVQQIVQRVDGDPGRGAVAGALIGGFLLRGHLAGALMGAAVGAAASQGSSETRTYQVVVQFDDGVQGVFTYRDYAPFAPGQPVVLTPQGLAAR